MLMIPRLVSNLEQRGAVRQLGREPELDERTRITRVDADVFVHEACGFDIAKGRLRPARRELIGAEKLEPELAPRR
jgi:hypothetical protein